MSKGIEERVFRERSNCTEITNVEGSADLSSISEMIRNSTMISQLPSLVILMVQNRVTHA